MSVVALIVIALLVALCVALAVLFSKALRTIAENADRAHARQQAAHDRLLDRFMAADFASYKNFQVAEQLTGEFLTPDQQKEEYEGLVATSSQRWGTLKEEMGDDEGWDVDDPLPKVVNP